jgi:hypothetical protein
VSLVVAGISGRALKELYTLSMMQPAWIDAKYRLIHVSLINASSSLRFCDSVAH